MPSHWRDRGLRKHKQRKLNQRRADIGPPISILEPGYEELVIIQGLLARHIHKTNIHRRGKTVITSAMLLLTFLLWRNTVVRRKRYAYVIANNQTIAQRLGCSTRTYNYAKGILRNLGIINITRRYHTKTHLEMTTMITPGKLTKRLMHNLSTAAQKGR